MSRGGSFTGNTTGTNEVRFLAKFAIALVLPEFVNATAAFTYTAADPVTLVPTSKIFNCTPTAVWDGDGPVWCAEGPRIRIAGVAAREMDGTCRRNHPCPAVGAIDARDRLVQLFGGARGKLPTGHVVVRSETMTCRSDGSARGARTAAWCTSPEFGDLSCAVIRAGGAVRWPRYWRGHQC
jgi:endonuclease YncB( thermonuclease family)